MDRQRPEATPIATTAPRTHPAARRIAERIEAGYPAAWLLNEHPGLSVHDLRDAVEAYLAGRL